MKGGEDIKRKLLISLTILGMVLVAKTNIAIADEIRYKIDNDTDYNKQKTTAVVDIETEVTPEREIRLPKYMPNMADFLGDGFEYIFLSPDGIKKVNTDGSETTVATDIPANNVTAIAGSGNTPDFIVAQGNSVTHYSFTGSDYVPNTALSSVGYTEILSVGTKELDHAALSNKIDYQAFTGSGMSPVPALSTSEFSNPIAMTVFKDHYGTAVIDGDTIKYFKEGNTVTASITGLTNVLSISASDGGNLAVVTDNQVKHYNLIDSTFVENTHLAITEELTSPTCVALRPGSYDRLVVYRDGIKYFMWTGTELVENTTMSRKVTGLQDMGKYLPSAVAESEEYILPREITAIKLFIDPALQVQAEGTSIEWYVTAQEDPEDGSLSNWVKIEQLNQWVILGEKSGNRVRWKAILKTTNRDNTPRINPDIVLQTNTKPDPPTINLPPLTGADRCYWNSTPTIRWQFNDPDDDPPTVDKQGAYQVLVWGGSMYEETEIIPGEITEYVVDADATGELYNSGVSIFNVTVRVWDEAGKEAGCNPEDSAESSEQFCVTAFDRPFIKLVVPINESYVPDYLPKGATIDKLPATKAGGLVEVEVDSIGVNSAGFKFPYATYESNIVGEPKIISTMGENNKWKIAFYTDADTDICPDGTIVNGYFTGNGIENLMYLDQSDPGIEPDTSTTRWWQWKGYRQWASGVVSVGESVFKNWSIILNGSQRN